jgi:hypothetical protein
MIEEALPDLVCLHVLLSFVPGAVLDRITVPARLDLAARAHSGLERCLVSRR